MKQRRLQGLPSAKKPDKSNQCQSGVHPNLVGQTAARCGLQSGKSARRLFSMLHLKAIRALTPLSTSGASPSLSSKNGTAPPVRLRLRIPLLDEPRPLLASSRAQAGPLSAKADGKPTVLSPISNRLRAKNDQSRPHVAPCTFVAMDPDRRLKCGSSGSLGRESRVPRTVPTLMRLSRP